METDGQELPTTTPALELGNSIRDGALGLYRSLSGGHALLPGMTTRQEEHHSRMLHALSISVACELVVLREELDVLHLLARVPELNRRRDRARAVRYGLHGWRKRTTGPRTGFGRKQ